MPGNTDKNGNQYKPFADPVTGALDQQFRNAANSGNGVGNQAAGAGADMIEGIQGTIWGTDQRPGLLGGVRPVGTPNQIDQSAFNIPYLQGTLNSLSSNAQAANMRQNVDPTQMNQSRDQQQQLMQMLQAQANGTGPSLAQAQLQKATDQNIANTMAMAASGRGPSAGGAMYNAQNQRSQAQQQGAADSAMLRMQEQMQATGMLANVTGQARGQDISTQGLNLQSQAMNDDLVKFYTQSGLSLQQAQQQAQQKLQELQMQQQIEFEKLRNDAYNGGDGGGKGIGSLLSIIGM